MLWQKSGIARGLRLGNLLVVDGVNGSDGLQDRKSGIPFRSLTYAKNASASGDCIWVLAATYTDNNLLKDGVNWEFESGAMVQWTASGVGNVVTNYGIFDDRAGAVSCKIAGKGTFKYTASDTDPNSNGLFTHKRSTRLALHCQRSE